MKLLYYNLKLIKDLNPNSKHDLLLYSLLNSHVALDNYFTECSLKMCFYNSRFTVC